MPKNLLLESQWVVWQLKSQVGVVGDDMVDVALRSTLKRNVICSVGLYSDRWYLRLIQQQKVVLDDQSVHGGAYLPPLCNCSGSY